MSESIQIWNQSQFNSALFELNMTQETLRWIEFELNLACVSLIVNCMSKWIESELDPGQYSPAKVFNLL